MQFYLKPVSSAETLFCVLDSHGLPVYTVKGDNLPFGCRLVLEDLEQGGRKAARISGVRLSSACQYSISCGLSHVRMTMNVAAPRRPVRFRGVPWHFRGSVLMRSFDLVDAQGKVVMTHSRCWCVHGDCFAVEIPDPENVPLCLGVAVVVDSIVLGGLSVLAPV
jgi:uncharacterized protein YxjI